MFQNVVIPKNMVLELLGNIYTSARLIWFLGDIQPREQARGGGLHPPQHRGLHSSTSQLNLSRV